MKLLLDENLSRRIVPFLQTLISLSAKSDDAFKEKGARLLA